MAMYYVNKNPQSSGEHEVHTGECYWLPNPENRLYLGSFSNCWDAIEDAKKHYSNVDGCKHCCEPCHTR
jgi:hypothetical protein